MTTSDMIRELCEKMNISLVELCRRIGQTPKNLGHLMQLQKFIGAMSNNLKWIGFVVLL